MQYFISTFIIMLICIIALLQDKSYEAGVVLPRPQNKLPDRRDDRLRKYSKAPHFVSKISPQLLINEPEAQTEVLASLLTGRFVNPSNSNKTTAIQTKPKATIHPNAEKGVRYANIFCSQCNLSFFAPACSCHQQTFKVLQTRQMTTSWR